MPLKNRSMRILKYRCRSALVIVTKFWPRSSFHCSKALRCLSVYSSGQFSICLAGLNRSMAAQMSSPEYEHGLSLPGSKSSSLIGLWTGSRSASVQDMMFEGGRATVG